MTCVVGIELNGGVVLAADSIGVSGSFKSPRLDKKVFVNGQYVIGYTSSYRMGQLLRYAELPMVEPDRRGEDLFKHMVTEFIPAIRELFKDAGYAKVDSNEESAGEFLVGVNGQLLKIASDYQVGRRSTPYDACGSGQAAALGALHITREMSRNPRQHGLFKVLYAVEACDAWVGAPFHSIALVDGEVTEMTAGS